MPSPRPHPHADEVDPDAWEQPPVICFLNGAPKFVQLQAAQGEPDEENADDYAEPELPFFHSGGLYHLEEISQVAQNWAVGNASAGETDGRSGVKRSVSVREI